MANRISGIHHVTAIASEPQANVDFYTGTLGMRLVKLTVNFDDPSSYHFYYGDKTGSPGSLLTFFAYPGAFPGQVGSGQASAVALSIPTNSLGYWADRLSAKGLESAESERFDERVLAFKDPDGMAVELVATQVGATEPWQSTVPSEHLIHGVHSVTLLHRDSAPTVETLRGEMGFSLSSDIDGRTRYEGTTHGIGRYVDLIDEPRAEMGRVSVGSIHHVAFRVPDREEQRAYRAQLVGHRYGVSPVTERDYFRSIYFRERGGVLFEIATDGPGMAIDEPVETLGQSLKLPHMYESHREAIEQVLQSLNLPAFEVKA